MMLVQYENFICQIKEWFSDHTGLDSYRCPWCRSPKENNQRIDCRQSIVKSENTIIYKSINDTKGPP